MDDALILIAESYRRPWKEKVPGSNFTRYALNICTLHSAKREPVYESTGFLQHAKLGHKQLAR